MTLKTKNIRSSLLKKGFSEYNNDHIYYVFLYNGIDIGLRTKISHSHKEISDDLINKMSKQLKMDKEYFKSFVDCEKSEDDYIELLKYKEIIE